MDCSEFYNTHVISNSIIQCRIYNGDYTQTPSIPTTIVIPITNNINANTQIRFNIIDLVNPSLASYPMGVLFKLASACSSSDINNLCTYYKSSTYLTFNNNPGTPGAGTTGSLTFNPTRVSANNTAHTVSAGYALVSGDFIRLYYYSQIPIPSVCTLSSNNGYCYSYPTTNSIIIKANVTISSPYSFTLTGMNNPYQITYGTYTFLTYIWKSGSITNVFYTNYAATLITTDPTSSTALSISFTPTLTTGYGYFLKYSFSNIALITITNMMQNLNIQQIYIWAPG